MEYIDYELEYIRSQKKLVENVITNSVMELEDEIRETIKRRWLRSESVDGGNITNKDSGSSAYVRLSYKALKLMINPSGGGRIDLTLTGSLGDKIKIVPIGSGDFEIISTDSKYGEIGKVYGFDEFGLNEQEKQYFMKKLEEKINLKL